MYSSFGLYYFFNLVTRLGSSPEHIELLVSLGAVLAGLLFVFIPRRLGPIALALPLACSSSRLPGRRSISLRTYGFFARYETGLGRDSSWIEETLGRNRPVTFLYSEGGADKFVTSQALLQAEFWNRNVDRVVNTGRPELCPLPEESARVDPATGVIRSVGNDGRSRAHWPSQTQSVGLAGRVVGRHAPLVAYRTPACSSSPARTKACMRTGGQDRTPRTPGTWRRRGTGHSR